ncbi:RelA/SpoT family protein [Neisseria shayeganii]|uniref:Guanosine-3',5'-bis(Diphosphate) 3'-pyrophosphohydrolase n=1 Tax=Neisseria shayeganii 871 TaxID=1032488 RepID=G4CFG9_9NEIS|nr:bifunctional (p)ppGpp synthetase/guanosine-3',5'-bis(diphosphate) 3'-pyrophosphohydrolase [Neisseria shayeganii]EGY53433.1 guanosine-3',5'-bis(diphosphate) 3'-pyrophosphohydrolase [Neisseria shayeganii 871]
MIAPTADYDTATLSLRTGLFARVQYLKKEERWAMLEAACAYVFETAAKSGQTEQLSRAFALCTALAKEEQRVHALCAVLIQTAMEDLGTQAELDKLQPLFGDVCTEIIAHLNTRSGTTAEEQLALCRRQINEVYSLIIERERARLLQAAGYLNEEERALLNRACDFGIQAHEGQFRNSGVPYITHPMTVAAQLAGWQIDIQGLCAGVLHDVLEDTGTSKMQLAAEFGDAIADMVDGLSKLEKLEYNDQAQHQAESFRKLIMAMVKDIRVIIVKLSDRLHNMRTLDAKKPESRRRIAQETMEIYAQLANRIGLNHAYRELQDLSFMHLYPNRYSVLEKARKASRRNRRDVVGKVLSAFNVRLYEAGIEAQIKGREKNLYSIYKKMQDKQLHFAEVMDIYGFRVIVNSIPDCYAALGALHSLYKPKPGKLKDYIAIPKANGYQSLHTTLVGPFGLPIEVQIRTREMDKVAEEGVASHWLYKTPGGADNAATLRTHQWLQNILDFQAQGDNAIEFLEHVKVDLFPNEVYVFTPKGRILVLPEGATPIDFAYAVHTDIGHRCVGAKVNHNMVPLRTRLRTGDSVEIITSDKPRPNPAWLNFVVSGRARSAIRNQLKHTDRRDAVALGENLLQKALSGLLPKDVLLSEELKDQYLADLSSRNTSFEDILYEVGMGRLLPVSVAMHIAALAGEHGGSEVKIAPISVSGSESGRVRFAQCCHPIPGDSIKALLIKDQGLIIHRDHCPNVLKTDPEQQLDANWDKLEKRQYRAGIRVASIDTHGLLASLAQTISANGADIESVDTLSRKQDGTEGFIEFRFSLQVQNCEQLQKISHALQSIPQVRQVERV